MQATEPGLGPPILLPGQGLRTRIPEICSLAAWLLCPRTEGARCACPDTGGAVPAINSFCARDGSSPGAWPNSSHDLAHTAHEIPLLHTHTPFKSQTGNFPGQLVQTLPAKLENLKQREKLRHCLQETPVILHKQASTSAALTSQHQHYSSSTSWGHFALILSLSQRSMMFLFAACAGPCQLQTVRISPL